MTTKLNRADRKLLREMGITPWSTGEKSVYVARPDSIVFHLQEQGIPVTRENYLQVAFGEHPLNEPLDGEIEIQLPKELQVWEPEDEERE